MGSIAGLLAGTRGGQMQGRERSLALAHWERVQWPKYRQVFAQKNLFA